MPDYSLAIIGSRYYKKSTVKSLLEEGKKVFSKVTFVPIDRIRVVFEDNKPKLLFKDKNLLEYDACYPRISSKDHFLGEVVLKVLEESDIYCPVNLHAFHVTNHKYYTVKELAAGNFPIVDSSLFIDPESAKETLKGFGFPVVVKLLAGFAGKGVILVDNEKQLNSILDAVTLFEEFISAQKYVKGKNSDIRCYVIGEKVIAVRRTGKQGEWRANVSRGGTAEEIEPSGDMERIALGTAKQLGIDICAVDFIETKSGPAVIEVNFLPGPFYKYLGNRITREMARFIFRAVKKKKTKENRKQI